MTMGERGRVGWRLCRICPLNLLHCCSKHGDHPFFSSFLPFTHLCLMLSLSLNLASLSHARSSARSKNEASSTRSLSDLRLLPKNIIDIQSTHYTVELYINLASVL